MAVFFEYLVSTKKNNKVGETNYQSGKAFHIFRPKMFDADGNWTWGDLNIDEQLIHLELILLYQFFYNAEFKSLMQLFLLLIIHFSQI